jgi:hypothetical protein
MQDTTIPPLSARIRAAIAALGENDSKSSAQVALDLLREVQPLTSRMEAADTPDPAIMGRYFFLVKGLQMRASEAEARLRHAQAVAETLWHTLNQIAQLDPDDSTMGKAEYRGKVRQLAARRAQLIADLPADETVSDGAWLGQACASLRDDLAELGRLRDQVAAFWGWSSALADYIGEHHKSPTVDDEAVAILDGYHVGLVEVAGPSAGGENTLAAAVRLLKLAASRGAFRHGMEDGQARSAPSHFEWRTIIRSAVGADAGHGAYKGAMQALIHGAVQVIMPARAQLLLGSRGIDLYSKLEPTAEQVAALEVLAMEYARDTGPLHLPHPSTGPWEVGGRVTVERLKPEVPANNLTMLVTPEQPEVVESHFVEVHYAIGADNDPRTILRFEGLPDVSLSDADAAALVREHMAKSLIGAAQPQDPDHGQPSPEFISEDPTGSLAERLEAASKNVVTMIEFAGGTRPLPDLIRQALTHSVAVMSEAAEALRQGSALFWIVDEFNDNEGETFGIVIPVTPDVDAAIEKWARTFDALVAREEERQPYADPFDVELGQGDSLTFRQHVTGSALEAIADVADNGYSARLRILKPEGIELLLRAIADLPAGASLSLYKGTLSTCYADESSGQPTEIADLWLHCDEDMFEDGPDEDMNPEGQ